MDGATQFQRLRCDADTFVTERQGRAVRMGEESLENRPGESFAASHEYRRRLRSTVWRSLRSRKPRRCSTTLPTFVRLFPSDRYTALDPNQLTGLRVRLTKVSFC